MPLSRLLLARPARGGGHDAGKELLSDHIEIIKLCEAREGGLIYIHFIGRGGRCEVL